MLGRVEGSGACYFCDESITYLVLIDKSQIGTKLFILPNKIYMSEFISSINQIMDYGLSLDLIHQHTEDETLTGKTVQVKGRELVNYGSCSYLGLEKHPLLIKGAIDAINKYGTQFSSSRTYLSIGLYQELESHFKQLYGQPAIVTASTTLGHLAALPVIVEPQDAVILDLQVHSSVQMTVKILKAQKIPVHIIRHNSMEQLEDKVKKLRNKHRKIWYLADGIYSMYGDCAPMQDLERLLNQYKQLHLYIDDAHGMSWTGKSGMGYVRSQIAHHPKMVMATSLNKSFASAGGLLLFPNEQMAQKVRNCGSTLIFTGPVQPPMLGAACASAKLHASEDILSHQNQLEALINYTNCSMQERGIPQFVTSQTPLFFVPVGPYKMTSDLTKRIQQDGLFVNSAGFPAVPMKRGGLRFMLNNHLGKQDVDRLLDSIESHYETCLSNAETTEKAVAKSFNIPVFKINKRNEGKSDAIKNKGLSMTSFSSINAITSDLWNNYFEGRGNLDYANLQMLEQVFSSSELIENQWEFTYIIVRDAHGEIVLITFYTTALVKDDMLSDSAISKQVEEKRQLEPYYLTSKNVMLGSLLTKGEHLWLNREHPQWEQSLELLLNDMQDKVEETKASKLLLREFSVETATALKPTMLKLGMIQAKLPDVYVINKLDWANQDMYLKGLGQKYRYNVRKEILANEHLFELNHSKPQKEIEIKELYELYRSVYEQAYELNVFPLPYEFFKMACQHPHYDIMRLYLKNEDGSRAEQAIGMMLSYRNAGTYNALLVGLDYQYVRTHNTYKQLLYQTVMRAKLASCDKVDLAFTAGLEKKKVGAKAEGTYAYVQAMEHYSLAILDAMSYN